MTIDHIEWAKDYFALYRWAIRAARAAHARAHMNAYRAWKEEACYYLAKRHYHIMAQDNQ